MPRSSFRNEIEPKENRSGHAAGRRVAAAAVTEPLGIRVALIGIALVFLSLFLVLPLVVVFSNAFRDGVRAYVQAISDPVARAAIRLTLTAAAVAVPLNVGFGLAAAWLIGKFRFHGREVLTTLIEVPFSVSPVVAGLMYVLVFGRQGWLGSWLEERGIRIIFATPGIVLATIFVTLPFVARELIPLMREQGTEEEEAAITLGASGWMTFWRVTVPNIRWGLLYGAVLCAARAMGEFGAVSVVSGHIRGVTNTMTLHVEILYNEYQSTAAFAVASLLSFLALLTLTIKSVIEWRARRAAESSVTEREKGETYEN